MTSKRQKNKATVYKLNHYITFDIPDGEEDVREAIKSRLDWIGKGSSKVPKKGKSVIMEITDYGIDCDYPVWFGTSAAKSRSISFAELHEIYIMKGSNKKIIFDIRCDKTQEKKLVYFEAKNSSKNNALVAQIKTHVKALEEEKLTLEEEKKSSTTIEPIPSVPQEPQQKDDVEATEKQLPSKEQYKPESVETQVQQHNYDPERENKPIALQTYQTNNRQSDQQFWQKPPKARGTSIQRSEPVLSWNDTSRATENNSSETTGSMQKYKTETNLNNSAGGTPSNNIRIIFDNAPLKPLSSRVSTIQPQYFPERPQSELAQTHIKLAPRASPIGTPEVEVNSNRQTWSRNCYNRVNHYIVPRNYRRAESVPSTYFANNIYPHSVPFHQDFPERMPLKTHNGMHLYNAPEKNFAYPMNRSSLNYNHNEHRNSQPPWIDQYRMYPKRAPFSSESNIYFNGNPTSAPSGFNQAPISRYYVRPNDRFGQSVSPIRHEYHSNSPMLNQTGFTYHAQTGRSPVNYEQWRRNDNYHRYSVIG